MMEIVSLQSGMHLPFDLERHKNSSLQVFVGSSAAGIDGADLLLDNVFPRHAVIFQKRDDYNRGDGTWWIKPSSSVATIYIDTEKVSCEAKLLPGHVLSFVPPGSSEYDNSIKFTITESGKLQEALDDESGVSIRCKGLCANGVDENGMPKKLLDNVSFEVKKGEFVGIIGPSGCGKSSLMERLAGIGDWDSGEIWVNGRRLREVGEELARQRVFVVQNAAEALHADMTIHEELAAAHCMHAAACDEDPATDEAAIKKFQLGGEEFQSKILGKYSGGEKRRAALARAIALKPTLLLLDEPTAGLDPDREQEVMHWLKDVSGGKESGRSGCTVLCVTHVLSNVDLFDRLLVFASEGKLVLCEETDKPGEQEKGCSAAVKVLKRFKEAYPEGYGKNPRPINSIEDVFPILSRDQSICKRLEGCKEVAEPTQDKFPKARERTSFGRCFGGYFRCLWGPFTNTPRRRRFVDLLLLPALLAFVIRFVCNDYVKMGLNTGAEAYVLPFCSCLAVFWLGLVSSVRELVGERYPRRCLERREGVLMMPYLTSRYLWRLATAGCQAVVFSLAMILALKIEWKCNGGGWLTLFTVVPLMLSAWTGVLLGLAVSAFSTKTTSALGKVPYFAIAQLLFSKVVLDRDEYPLLIKVLKGIMPCDKTIESLKLLWYDPCKSAETMWMLVQFLGYAIVLLAVGAVAQRKREMEWEGR